jgi:acyl carrier protein phosphodiesterase
LANAAPCSDNVMNYLAHAFLAESSEEFLIGSFIGDFVKGPVRKRFTAGIVDGILFHRQTDTFADNHHLTRISRRLFSQQRRRFAGIILDICYDHFLSKHWPSYADVDLAGFIERVYGILERHRNKLPAKLQSALPRMVQQNWLACYGTLSGVDTTLNRIAQRISRENSLAGSINEVKGHYSRLEDNFLAFFPDLIDFARPFCAGDRDQQGKSGVGQPHAVEATR